MSSNAPRRPSCLGALTLLVLGSAPLAAQLPAPAVSSPHPIHLAGYASVVFGYSPQNPSEDRTAVPAATAAILLSGTALPRLSYFGDFQAASWTDENWTGQREENNLNIARLYAEYAFSDALRLRLGRFLTPVGQWNEIFAEPLTWTVLRPLTTYRPFAKSTTGVLLAGTVPVHGHDAGYAAYFSPPDWSREETGESGFVRAAGGRIAMELRPGLVLGASTARFRVSRPYQPGDPEYAEGGLLPPDTIDSPAEEAREAEAEGRWLFGVDLSWDIGRLELLSEAVSLSRTALRPGEHGGFLQAAIRVVDPVHLVLRSEVYDPVYRSTVAVQTVGVTMRFFRHATFKLERQFTDHPSERVRDGWFVSLSALF
ncbi:MAG TPA: hypothetical protein VJ957_04640 [Longimicrobiales bacterium]|nr:hypothetical protein [Longimicrobiales bacterium]